MTKQEQNQDLIKITETQHMLVGFKEKYNKENLPTADSKDGYNFLKSGIAELRTLRGRTEDHRKIIVTPLNDKVKEVNTLAKLVIAELAEIELPMKELKQVEDDRRAEEKAKKKKLEQDRKDLITAKIVKIMDSPIQLIEASPEKLQDSIDELMAIDPEEEFQEFVNSGEEAIDKSLTRLRSLKENAIKAIELAEIREKEEAEKQAQEQAQKEAEEAQRVKDQEELAKLRKEKQDRDAEDARLEAEKVEEPAEEVLPPEEVKDYSEEPEAIPVPTQKRILVKLDEIQLDISGLKEESITAVTGCIENETRDRTLNPSALAKVIFQAVYLGQIPNIKFHNN